MKIKTLLAAIGLVCAAIGFAAPKPEENKTFEPPKLSDPASWTMVVVPDVQAYVERPRNHGILDIMNAWIVDNLDTLKIQQVLFTGDLVFRNDQKNLTPNRNSLLGKEQWKAFSRLMKRLDGRVPYILCTGNHDYGHKSAENRNSWFDRYFPTDRNPQTRKHLVCCSFNSLDVTTLENSAYEFTAPAPDKWERGIAFSTDKNESGKTVAQMAFNTQAIGGGFHGSGGDGWLRLLEFLPDRKTVKATTYSPFFGISPSTRHLAWKHDKLSEFTFTIE